MDTHLGRFSTALPGMADAHTTVNHIASVSRGHHIRYARGRRSRIPRPGVIVGSRGRWPVAESDQRF